MADAGSYQCKVSNGNSSASCNKVNVKVLEKVRITKQLSSQVLTAGDNIELNIGASGAKPLTYRCYKDGTLLVTSSNPADLIIPGSTENDSGSYRCNVSNAGSSASTISADITVLTDYNGTIQLAWSAPKKREDGSSLGSAEIHSYNIYLASGLDQQFDLAHSTETTTATLSGLVPRTYYLSLTTVDTNNMESARSAPVAITVR
jgi:hypothetical protein